MDLEHLVSCLQLKICLKMTNKGKVLLIAGNKFSDIIRVEGMLKKEVAR